MLETGMTAHFLGDGAKYLNADGHYELCEKCILIRAVLLTYGSSDFYQ